MGAGFEHDLVVRPREGPQGVVSARGGGARSRNDEADRLARHCIRLVFVGDLHVGHHEHVAKPRDAVYPTCLFRVDGRAQIPHPFERYEPVLRELQTCLERDGLLRLRAGRFLIAARKVGAV